LVSFIKITMELPMILLGSGNMLQSGSKSLKVLLVTNCSTSQDQLISIMEIKAMLT